VNDNPIRGKRKPRIPLADGGYPGAMPAGPCGKVQPVHGPYPPHSAAEGFEAFCGVVPDHGALSRAPWLTGGQSTLTPQIRIGSSKTLKSEKPFARNQRITSG
jgi:hypothetical protein